MLEEELTLIPETIIEYLKKKIYELAIEKAKEQTENLFESENCDEKPEKPGKKPEKPENKPTQISTPTWPRSVDPNEIIRSGSKSFGENQYIQDQDEFFFKILYENYFNASAPARDVYIELPIDINYDIETIKYSTFGFGNFTKEIVFFSSVNEILTVSSSSSYSVEVNFYTDEANRMAVWKFITLDINTLQPIDDVDIGFLPPNRNKSGEGFVEFKMKKISTCKNNCNLKARAKIVFDTNEPIFTNQDYFTIDSNPPQLDAVFNNETNEINLFSKEAESGIRSIDLYLMNNASSSFEFYKTLTFSHTIKTEFLSSDFYYELKMFAIDNVNNKQIYPTNLSFYKRNLNKQTSTTTSTTTINSTSTTTTTSTNTLVVFTLKVTINLEFKQEYNDLNSIQSKELINNFTLFVIIKLIKYRPLWLIRTKLCGLKSSPINFSGFSKI